MLDSDIAQLVPDLEMVDTLDARHLLDEVDQLRLEHRTSKLPALAIAAADKRVEEPTQLGLDVFPQAIGRSDRATDEHDAQRDVLVARTHHVEHGPDELALLEIVLHVAHDLV